MSLKSYACLAALCAMSAPALAVPSISLVDNGSGNATLNVTTDAAGSLAAEIGITLGAGLTLVDATVNTTLFDDANPGDNPYINGLDNPAGGDTTGLFTDVGAGQIFAAYGSGDLGIGTFELLSFNYTGSDSADASGVVAQLGLVNDVLMDTAVLGDAGSGLLADANGDGTVDLLDLAILGNNFNLTPATFAQGDFNGDSVVDLLDLSILGSDFGNSASAAAAIPEPTSAALLLGGVIAGCIRRRV